MNTNNFLLAIILFLTSCSNPQTQDNNQTPPQASSNPTNKVILNSEIKWEQLNPARGDKSPKAATIWGDRKGPQPTGFLVKFVDGFSSPPHIHNVTYRGVVISGLIHNDDENAEKMWMPAGSFWTQPVGQAHITSAKGNNSVAYIEIDKGPYLVQPAKEAFDKGERPVNIDKSNIVWLDASSTTLINNPDPQISTAQPAVAFLWGNLQKGKLRGNFIKLPAGFKGEVHSSGSIFHAVVIEGKVNYQFPGKKDIEILEPSSYFTSTGKSIHQVTSKGLESIIYVRSNDAFKISSKK